MAKSEGTNPVRNDDDLVDLYRTMTNPYAAKSSKEAALRRIRELEREHKASYWPPYNSRSVSELARMDEENKG